MVKAYFSRLVLFTAVVAIVVAALNYFSPFFRAFQLFTWLSLGFFFVVTAVTLNIALNGLKKKSSHGFVASINGTVLIKLFLSIALIIGYMLLTKPGNAAFIIPFFCFYILFTFFEIRQLLNAQKAEAGRNIS